MKVNTLSTKKRLMPFLQLRSPWEKTYTKQLVETFFRHEKNNALITIDAIKCLARLKWVRKGGKFSLKRFGPFTVHSISTKNLCSLINKDRTLIKTKENKYNVSLLKSYLDLDDPPPSPPPPHTHTHPSQRIRRTITWYWKSRSSKFNG